VAPGLSSFRRHNTDPFGLAKRHRTACSNRDKASLDIFWLRDESLEESDNLPDPDVLAQEIVDDIEAALEQFREIVIDLTARVEQSEKI